MATPPGWFRTLEAIASGGRREMAAVNESELTARESEILSRYDLGEVRAVETLSGGMFLQPRRLETTKGSFVLRGHSFRQSEAALRFQAEALDHLHAKGVAVPRILRDEEGRPGVESGGVIFAVHEFIAGRTLPWEEWCAAKRGRDFLRGIGRKLARIHDLLAEASPGGDAGLAWRLPPIQFGSLDDVIELWDEDMASLAAAAPADATRCRQAFLENREVIRDAWRRLREAVPADLALPEQIVHGDLSPVNLVFQENDAFIPIDWDCIHLGYRIYDALGDVLNRPPVTQPQYHRFNVREVRELLRGYEQGARRSLTEMEVQLVPAFCLSRQLEDLRQRMALVLALPAERDKEYAQVIRIRLRIMAEIIEFLAGNAFAL